MLDFWTFVFEWQVSRPEYQQEKCRLSILPPQLQQFTGIKIYKRLTKLSSVSIGKLFLACYGGNDLSLRFQLQRGAQIGTTALPHSGEQD